MAYYILNVVLTTGLIVAFGWGAELSVFASLILLGARLPSHRAL